MLILVTELITTMYIYGMSKHSAYLLNETLLQDPIESSTISAKCTDIQRTDYHKYSVQLVGMYD